MQRLHGAFASTCLAALFVTASPAYAQGQPAPVAPQLEGGATADSLDLAARLLFESAREAFDAGDYATAHARFEQAYAASPRPALLFNIATSLDRLRRDDEALAAFERYLAADPSIVNRTAIEARVRSLREAIDAREEAERARLARSQVVEPDDDAGGLSPVLFVGAGGLAVVSGVLAIWAGVSTMSLNDDYELYVASPGASREQGKLLFDDASSRQLLTNVFLGGALLFGAAAAVLFFFTDWDGSF